MIKIFISFSRIFAILKKEPAPAANTDNIKAIEIIHIIGFNDFFNFLSANFFPPP